MFVFYYRARSCLACYVKSARLKMASEIEETGMQICAFTSNCFLVVLDTVFAISANNIPTMLESTSLAMNSPDFKNVDNLSRIEDTTKF